MKAKIGIDEWYPVYTLDDDEGSGRRIEIPYELYTRYKNNLEEFDKIQDTLSTIYENI